MKNVSPSKSNFYLVNMKPSLSVMIDVKEEISSPDFRSILSFCKQWNIKKIILKVYDLKNTKIFDHLYSAIADTFLFAADEFYFYLQYENLELSLIHNFWKKNESPEEFLLSFLNHNAKYEKYASVFGTNIFKFFDFEPETINVKIDKNKIDLIISNPENVFALYISEKNELKEKHFHNIDLQKHFNFKTGHVIISWKRSKEVHLYVLRKYVGYFEESVHQILNYFSEKVFKSYLQYLSDNLEKNLSLFNGWYLDPFQLYNQPQKLLPVSSNFVQTFKDKSDQDYSKAVLNFWYNSNNDSHHQCTDLFNFSREEIQKVFKKSYKNHLKTNDKKIVFNLNEIGQKVQQYGIPLYIFDFAKNINEFNISVNANLIFPNGTYAKEKETELRIASSISHHYNNKIGTVTCGDLLNINANFEEKLWYVNWLVSCGINDLSQSINYGQAEFKSNLYSNLPTYDPSYVSYKNWFKYINTITHFSSKGTHRCDILVLYPIQSYFYGNIVDLSIILPLIANEGIDFDLIDFDGFVNNDQCKIIDDKLSVNKEKYSILILPGVEIIPIEVLRRIYEFYSSGGTVIAIGNLPSKSTNWDKDNEIESISNEIWFKKSTISSTKFKTNKWGGKGFFQSDISLLPEIIKENRNLINLQIQSYSGKIRSIVRETSTEYFILLFNMSNSKDFQGNVYSKYKGKPFIWDFDNNEAIPYYNFKIKDTYLKFPIDIPVGQSKLIILKKQSLKALPKILSTNLCDIVDIKIKNQKISINGLVYEKGKYEVEVSLFNVKKKASKNIQKFLPALTISSKNWNIEFNNKKFIENLGDLSRYDQTYCGTIIYKKIIVISEEYLNGYKVMIDLGKLKDSVEIIINNKNLGICILPPYRLDITDSIQSGDNKFEFRIKNNLFNILSSLQTTDRKYNYIKEYGLYGPVKLIPYQELEFNC